MDTMLCRCEQTLKDRTSSFLLHHRLRTWEVKTCHFNSVKPLFSELDVKPRSWNKTMKWEKLIRKRVCVCFRYAVTVWYFDREERKRAKQQQQVDGAYEQYSLLSLNLSFCVLLFSPIEFNHTLLLLSACSHCGKANTIFFLHNHEIVVFAVVYSLC